MIDYSKTLPTEGLVNAYIDFNEGTSDIHDRNGSPYYSSELVATARAYKVSAHDLADFVSYKWGYTA